tara:strand:+ start:1354 stop:1992 length:639 start_codon:yes stop_codon:yes gene_type:complete
MISDWNKVEKEIRNQGYSVFQQSGLDFNHLAQSAIEMCKDDSYERGSVYRSHVSNFNNSDLAGLIFSRPIFDIFNKDSCIPQDVFITHEFKNDISRNNYLHFDRLRCLKVLVYLQDVDEDNGPFSIVPKSHIKGAELRRSFSKLNDYEEKKNRIDIDYPEIKYDLKKIIGPAGTTIIFDSDIFHCGGNVSQGRERLVIRSHWYKDYNWRVTS